MNNLETIRNVKRNLIRMRKEIEAVVDVEDKKKALQTYAHLLTSLEMGTLQPRERRSG